MNAPPIMIKECANGYIVKPAETDANVVIADEHYQVFETIHSLCDYIELHFTRDSETT